MFPLPAAHGGLSAPGAGFLHLAGRLAAAPGAEPLRGGDSAPPGLPAAGPCRRQVAGRVYYRGNLERSREAHRDTNDSRPCRVPRSVLFAGRWRGGARVSFLIERLHARQVLDSRGDPTVEVEVTLEGGARASAMVPAGASTGRHEACELRDGPGGGYGGRSVMRAVGHVNTELARALAGADAREQAALDRRMIELDGTPNKSRLGANAILGVSMAVARAAAAGLGVPLWNYLAGSRAARLPLPMINIISGGLHAGRNLEFQDFLVEPHGFPTCAAALEAAVRIHRKTGETLRAARYALTGVADEGGFGPRMKSNRAALDLLTRAIEAAGFESRRQVSIAIDVASSHFYRDGLYRLASEGRELTASGMGEMLAEWIDRYPVVSVEDPLAEDDWDGWREITARLGSGCRLVGDDLFATNIKRLERGIREGVANAVLVKMNQIGTLTETFEVIDRAREAGYAAVISARSGETEDSFLADLAVASGAGHIKVGSVTRSERLSKYNRLLAIEDEPAAPPWEQ
ncbi:MAG: phosphopyruvate hydratase [Acidobacteria bacterium]|nr:phosphopyruvate hydratase [Acidobacteriota bacterium]